MKKSLIILNFAIDKPENMVYNKFTNDKPERRKSMSFDYSKLDGKITEHFATRGLFAKALGVSERTMSLKMSGKVPWKQPEIVKACSILDIEICDIPNYFFAT